MVVRCDVAVCGKGRSPPAAHVVSPTPPLPNSGCGKSLQAAAKAAPIKIGLAELLNIETLYKCNNYETGV